MSTPGERYAATGSSDLNPVVISGGGAMNECKHNPDSLPYTSAHADAARRLARGQRQTQCQVCKKWFWRHEFKQEPS